MYRILNALPEILISSVWILPVFVLYGVFLFRRAKTTVFSVVFAFYLVAVLSLVGFPSVCYMVTDVSVNVIPLVDILSDATNACLNVLLFVPLGVFLPVYHEIFRTAKHTVPVGFVLSCLIEFAQIFTFRTTDVNDLITNTLGTFLGYLLTRIVTKKFSRFVLSDAKAYGFPLTAGTVFLMMFFVQPLLSDFLGKFTA